MDLRGSKAVRLSGSYIECLLSEGYLLFDAVKEQRVDGSPVSPSLLATADLVWAGRYRKVYSNSRRNKALEQ